MKKIIVYCNVVADIPHRGHVEFFRKAKALGDILIVGVHPDDIVKKYKRKPIMSFNDRVEILKSIKEIDMVVEDCRHNRHPTVYDNLKKYNVDLIVHGNDFTPPYEEEIKRLKLPVKCIQVPYYSKISTTSLLKDIRSMSKLKSRLTEKEKLVIASAGDAITAKLVEEFNFDGIWISSFEVSARHGLVDNGTLTMTEMLNTSRSVVDAVNIPVIVDVDNGYGGLTNFVRAVKSFESIGVSAICVEDNLFPKKNSLWGGKLPIESMEKHGAKIKAGKEVQRTNDFCIIARTEALIRGYGKTEAINRANYYADCGADLILMHSRDKTGKEALEMPKFWTRNIPLVIIPSKFPHLKNQELFDAGYSVVIFANQIERAKIKSIKDFLRALKTSDCIADVNDKMCSLDELRNLTPIEETENLERKYGI